MSGSIHHVWKDHQLYPATSADTWPILITLSHKHKHKCNKVPVPVPSDPLHMLHLNLINNPFSFGLTPPATYSAYIFIVITPGKLVGWVGLLLGESSQDIYKCLKCWLLETQLHRQVNKICIICTDAGSTFMSPWFNDWCSRKWNIKLESAAPHHQQQNGICCETKWKELHTTANMLLNNAHLGGAAFFHHVHQYIAEIINCPWPWCDWWWIQPTYNHLFPLLQEETFTCEFPSIWLSYYLLQIVWTHFRQYKPSLKELIIQVKLVLKAKQTASGTLQNLKAHLIARGDMEKCIMKKQAQETRLATEKQW